MNDGLDWKNVAKDMKLNLRSLLYVILLELFEREYSFEKYTEEEIRMNIGNSLSKLAKNRKDILKEGWNKVYEVCEQKEKEK